MKAEVGKIDIAKLDKVPISLNNWKRKLDDLSNGKIETVSMDFKKLSELVW